MKKWIVGCLGLLILGGCQSPTSFSPQAPQLQSLRASQNQSPGLFPAKAGYAWKYDVTMSPVMDPMVEYKGTYDLSIEKINPKTKALELRATNSFNNRFSFPAIVQTPNQVSLKDMTFLGHGSDAVRGLSIDFIKLPLKPGMSWKDPNWIGKVKGQERVTVPAGNFQAWRIEVIGTFEHAYTAVGDYWIVPGKGIVKSTLTIPNWHIESVLSTSGLR